LHAASAGTLLPLLLLLLLLLLLPPWLLPVLL
jgi:hypothetical protein